jgi:hypothetical protein
MGAVVLTGDGAVSTADVCVSAALDVLADGLPASDPHATSVMAIDAAQAVNAMERDTREEFTAATLQPCQRLDGRQVMPRCCSTPRQLVRRITRVGRREKSWPALNSFSAKPQSAQATYLQAPVGRMGTGVSRKRNLRNE